MNGSSFLLQAFVYLAAAVISVPIAKRLGLGSVLGYIIAGIAIGPFGLSLIGEEGQDVMHFAEFGVVMMLFIVGLELEPKRLWRLRGPILGLGALQMVVTACALGGTGLLLGLSWQSALAVGLILATSSTAIGIQTLSEKRLLSTSGGQNAFSVLLFQDIGVIPILAILPLLSLASATQGNVHSEATWIGGLATWAQTLVVLGTVGAIVVAGLFIMRPLFRIIAKTGIREIFTAAALMLIIGTAMVMLKVGLSPALGTFLAGVVLGGSEYRHELESEIDPFKGLLLGLFFIAVGAGIDFSLLLSKPDVIGSLLGILFAIKLLVLVLIGRGARMSINQNLLFAVTLASGGEFAFVLFSYAAGHHVLSSQLVSMMVLVVALSMACSPVLFLIWERVVSPRLAKTLGSQRTHDSIDDRESLVIIAGFGRFGNIVGRLLRANGVRPTVLDVDSDNVTVLRKVGLPVFYGDASRPDLLLAAGASKAKVIVLATDDHDSNMKMVSMVKKHFSHLKILARAHGRTQAYDLIDAGVDHVYRETLDTSLKMGIDVLKCIGLQPHQALRASRIFRRHDEDSLQELRKVRENKKRYLSRTKERIQDLEELLSSELNDWNISNDAAWDTESRRQAALARHEKEKQ